MPTRIKIIVATVLGIAIGAGGVLTWRNPQVFEKLITAESSIKNEGNNYVDGNQHTSGTTEAVGDATFHGDATVIGDFSSHSVIQVSSSTIVSSTTTQKLAALCNTSGRDRISENVWANFTSDGSGTAMPITITSAFSSVFSATGTGADLLYNSWVTMPASASASSTFTTTSTPMDTARDIWYDGQCYLLATGSPTSSIIGELFAAWRD